MLFSIFKSNRMDIRRDVVHLSMMPVSKQLWSSKPKNLCLKRLAKKQMVSLFLDKPHRFRTTEFEIYRTLHFRPVKNHPKFQKIQREFFCCVLIYFCFTDNLLIFVLSLFYFTIDSDLNTSNIIQANNHEQFKYDGNYSFFFSIFLRGISFGLITSFDLLSFPFVFVCHFALHRWCSERNTWSVQWWNWRKWYLFCFDFYFFFLSYLIFLILTFYLFVKFSFFFIFNNFKLNAFLLMLWCLVWTEIHK